MRLITTFRNGFIAPKDITVYKQLKKIDSKWHALDQSGEVKLGSELIPDKSTPEIIEHPHNCMIEGGVIYSSLSLSDIEENDYSAYFKAIIPKGTQFWLQDDLDEIVSEKLYLTSERVYGDLETDLSFLYQSHCLDLLLNNGERVKWSSDVNPGDVKGIFVYDSQAIDLDTLYDNVFSSTPFSNLPNKILDNDEAEKDFSGRERTKYLRKNYPDIEILRGLPEDSYIPSLGELSRALENFLFINLTRKALGLDILGYDWFWSSTPYSDEDGWYTNPGSCNWLNCDGCLWDWLAGAIVFFSL